MADHVDKPGGEATNAKISAMSGDVVSLQAVAQNLRFPVVGDLEDYWQSLRGTRLLPSRSEIDPRKIENTLEYAFIIERIAPGMARFRLAGMHLNDLMGMEVRGMPVSAFFGPDARRTLSDAMERTFDDPAIARLQLSAETGVGRPAIEARMLLLPLKSDFGDVSRALGCLVTQGAIGRTPRRFEIAGVDIDAIAGPQHAGDRRIKGWSQKTHKAGVPEKQAPSRRFAGLAEAAKAFVPSIADSATLSADALPSQAPRPPRAEGRPNLVVVHRSE